MKKGRIRAIMRKVWEQLVFIMQSVVIAVIVAAITAQLVVEQTAGFMLV